MGKPARALRILVVEDDPLVRDMAVTALAEEGFDVVEAETAEQALARYAEATADMLVTDIELQSDLTGWDVAEQCRESSPALPVIYASGHSGARPRSVPGSSWLQKPYGPDQLVHTVRHLASTRSESSG
jgi:CheY-like chemotaxis protein